MARFVIQCERKTWTKYLVEAEDEDTALEASGDWLYLGYLDGEDTEHIVVGGPFENEAEALADVVSYVEG